MELTAATAGTATALALIPSIESKYQDSINQTIEEAKDTGILTEESTNNESEENKGWNNFTSKVKDVISNIGDNVSEWIHKGEKVLSNFIDAIAILLITSCIIPITVLIFFIWIIKIIFGVHIPASNTKKAKLNNNIKTQKSDNSIDGSMPESEINKQS